MTNTMWWYLTRASALTAWAFFTLTMVWGTIVSTRLVQRARARRWLLDLHPYLGGIGLAALVLHIVSLLMDSKAHIALVNVVVPFSTSTNRFGVALGVLGIWILLAVEATSVAKRWLPKKVWHGVHLFSYVAAWAMAVHAVTTGTDMKQPVVAWGSLVLVALTTLVTLRKVLVSGSDAGRGPAGAAAAPGPRDGGRTLVGAGTGDRRVG
ncbi:MAG TPA: hypothetical protein VIJ47_07790 [Acidimicrobiales bacterium]